MKKQRKPSFILNILFAVCAVLCAVYYVALGLTVRFNQSLMWIWPIICFCLLLRHVLVARMRKTGKPSPIPHVLLVIMHSGILILFALFVYVETLIIGAGLVDSPAGLDYIIVLGAKVNGTQPGGALRNRIQVAGEYALANPDTVIIASGAQGDDEGISEAECIYNGLIACGISPDRIILEDKSTSTRENIHNTMELIEYDADTQIGLVTNDFHLYRSLRHAATVSGCQFYGISTPTSFISYPHYAIREFAALIVEFLQGTI